MDAMTRGTRHRISVHANGTIKLEKRIKRLWRMAPAAPNSQGAATGAMAFLFRCPYTRHMIAATMADRRKVHGFQYVCYHTFPQTDAAIMYALSVGGG